MAHTFFIVLAYEYHFPAHIIPFRMFSPTSCCPFSYGASKQAIREMEICCYEGFTRPSSKRETDSGRPTYTKMSAEKAAIAAKPHQMIMPYCKAYSNWKVQKRLWKSNASEASKLHSNHFMTLRNFSRHEFLILQRWSRLEVELG